MAEIRRLHAENSGLRGANQRHERLEAHWKRQVDASKARLARVRRAAREFMQGQRLDRFIAYADDLRKLKAENRNKEIEVGRLRAEVVCLKELIELKTAFLIGFQIYLPFVILDLVVASVLMSMGMMMLSPVLISLPFKLMLFVLVDGWSLVMGTLAASFYT